MSGKMDNQVMQVLRQMNQQHETLQEQLNVVEQQLLELQHFREELSMLSAKENTQILAPLGKSAIKATCP